MNSRLFVLMWALAGCWGAAERGIAATVASNQGSGQDGLVYSFSSVPFPISNTFPFIGAGKTEGGTHDLEALVQFDLSTIGLASSQVTSATLELFVVAGDSGFGGAQPSPAQPVQVDVFPLLGSWNRDTVTWSNKPERGDLLGSFTVDGTGIWLSFDVTPLVQDWLDSPGLNFGLILSANEPVGSSPNWIYASFASGFGDFAANAPRLSIVPEPGALGPAACGLAPLGWSVLRRARRKKGRAQSR